MSLYALDDLDDAVSATKSFLFPFYFGTWVKLAIVVFFIGGGFNVPTTGGSVPPSQVEAGIMIDPPPELFALVGGIVVVVIILALLFGIIGAIMEFVFFESLRHENVELRRYWSDRWRQGVRLFLFRLVIAIPVILLILGWIALVVVPLFLDIETIGISVGIFLLGVPMLFVISMLYGLVNGFTTVFVVPLMIQKDSGVMDGWRRLMPSIRREWKQYLGYTVTAFVLLVIIGVIASVIVAIAALLLLVPLGLIGLITLLSVSFPSPIALLILAVLVVIFLLAMAIVWALVQIPLVTFFRYYALLVLGDIETDFDIIPHRRRAIRKNMSE